MHHFETIDINAVDMVTDADAVSAGLDKASTVPFTEADSLERIANVIKSSPPALPAHVAEIYEPLPQEGKSDSEAETVVLPGVNGYSPFKVRRVIKVEDNISINDGSASMDIDIEDTTGGEVVGKELQKPNERALSNLGKRKRLRHGNTSNEHSHNGNSSSLSSVLSSPSPTTRSSLSKPADLESDISRSSSPQVNQNDKTNSVDKRIPKDAGLEIESRESKEQRKRRRQDTSSSEAAGKQSRQVRDSGSPQQSGNPSQNRTRSASPHPPAHRRSASNGAISGLSHKKKKIPAPLRATRDRRSTEDHSDDGSSVAESPHPRQSRTRNLTTPPTGESSSLAKMGPHKKRHPFGRTVLVDFCDTGNYEMAKQHVDEHPDHIDVADPAGNTPLQCASLKGFEDIVKLLIDAGCNVNCINNEKESPLFDAVENGHLGVVRMLLDAGANPRARNQEGEEPIDVVDDDCEDAAAIRASLRAARLRSAHTQPSIPVQSTHPGSSSSTSGRTQRSTKTGEHHLWAPKDKIALRKAAARGDVETAGNVLVVLADETFDDPESLVAAAKGGHEEVLNLLLGFSANPDPEPLEDKDWEHATPILAAIGGENIKVIELLLSKVEDGMFDPTKRYNGCTYYEIARQRKGPLWQEEERALRAAFDNYRPSYNSEFSITIQNHDSTPRPHQKKFSDSSGRPNGPKSKEQRSTEPYQNIKQETKAIDTNAVNSTPVRRGPGRPRKEREWRESSVNLDRDILSPATQRERDLTSEKERENGKTKRSESDNMPIPSDSDRNKPRRKLMSRQEINNEREKQQRRASIASTALTTSSTTESVPSVSPRTKLSATKASTSRLISSEPDVALDKTGDRARSIKREGSKDRLSAMRGESPVKRARSSLTPPYEFQDSSSLKVFVHGNSAKRRRIDSDSKSATRSEGRLSSSPDHRTSDQLKASTDRVSSHRNPARDQKHSRPIQASHHKKIKSENASSNDGARVTVAEAGSRDDTRRDTDRILSSERKVVTDRKSKHAAKAKKYMDAERPIKLEAEVAEAARAKEQTEAESLRKRLAVEELERQRLEAQLAQIKKEREVEDAMRRQQEEADAQRRAQEEADAQRRAREEAEAQRRAQEEADAQRRAQEQADAQRRAQEEAEAQRRVQEEQRLLEEQRRAMIADQERREREMLAALEAARLAKLPLLLRWFDGLEHTATHEFASKFRVIQGVRYDTIKPEATGNPDARDQWLLNTQIALLLGEKDLSLSRCVFSFDVSLNIWLTSL